MSSLSSGRKKSYSPDLSTSQGLLNVARKAGLEEKAKKKTQFGEDPNQIFSGGFISDIFDVLNAPQSVVVALSQGENLMEGVKGRRSFSDADIMGRYGTKGKIAGIATDIATDPLNFIPVFGIGKMIMRGIKGGSKLVKSTKAGEVASDFLGRKFVYRYGADPVYAKGSDDLIRKVNKGWERARKLGKPITELSAEEQKVIANARKAGKISSLSPRLLGKAKPAFDELDRLSLEAVENGLISRKAYEESSQYLPRLYRSKEGNVGDFISRFKERKDIPLEVRQAMGEIFEAGYPTVKALGQISQAVETSKWYNSVALHWASDVAKDGYKQLPNAKRLLTTSEAEMSSIYKRVKDLNKEIKPSIRELNKAYKGNKAVTKMVRNLDDSIKNFTAIQKDEFVKFFNEGKTVMTIVNGARRLGTLPLRLQEIAQEVKGFRSFGELMKSKLGKKLELLHQQGFLERAGIKSPRAFWDRIKHPYTPAYTNMKDKVLKGNIKKMIKLQRSVEDLQDKVSLLKGIDRRSVQDSLRHYEDVVNKIRLQKEEVLGQVEALKMGKLAGKYVPQSIYDDLVRVFDPPTKWRTIEKKAVSAFKYGKVVLNPATHARNIMSNYMLNNFAGIPSWRMPDLSIKAMREIRTQGKFFKEVENLGELSSGFWGSEIKELLLNPMDSKAKKMGKEAINFFGKLYQNEERFSKMMMFVYQRERGTGVRAAWSAAETATFNYAKVTPFIRRLRESAFGLPFVTFTVKATPLVAKTAITHPARIGKFGLIKRGFESMSPEDQLTAERANEPDYIKSGFFVRLPFEDKLGRAMYFDMTYIMPFGDLLSGNWLEAERKGETLLTSTLRKNPVFGAVGDLYSNTDFFGEPIIKASSTEPHEAGRDILVYLTKQFAPPPLTLTPERILQATQISGMSEAEIGTKRTITQEILRNFGLKVTPFNLRQEQSRREREAREELTKLLEEEDVIATFKRGFIPRR